MYNFLSSYTPRPERYDNRGAYMLPKSKSCLSEIYKRVEEQYKCSKKNVCTVQAPICHAPRGPLNVREDNISQEYSAQPIKNVQCQIR